MDTLTLERANAAAIGIMVTVGVDDRPGPDDAPRYRWAFGEPIRRNACPLCKDGTLTIESSAICRACMLEKGW